MTFDILREECAKILNQKRMPFDILGGEYRARTGGLLHPAIGGKRSRQLS